MYIEYIIFKINNWQCELIEAVQRILIYLFISKRLQDAALQIFYGIKQKNTVRLINLRSIKHFVDDVSFTKIYNKIIMCKTLMIKILIILCGRLNKGLCGTILCRMKLINT